ncbi:hypothetical protein ABZ863_27115 [Saccharomonospora sp. NPDC046836]|uniref:hypothetical protein n=1 Tax=Saccharomonospora sp. NPDC046836 TaxID=3156921 RepID=UPI0033E64CA8
MTVRHKLLACLAVPSLVVSSLVVAPATAGADPLSLSNFELRPNAYGTDLRDRADALPLVKATVSDIMNDLNRKDDNPVQIHGACEPAAVADADIPPLITRSLCFQNDDNETTQWYPQGVTTVADMQADQEWGSGNQPVLVSWYDKNDPLSIKGVRISFMNPYTGAYRHVLLVYPKTIRARPDYESVRVSQDITHPDHSTSLHAGGIVWYGNYLFVADTNRGFRMFDMRRIYDLGASKNGTTEGPVKVGFQEDTQKYHAYAYRYIMPQVGSWTRTAADGTDCSASDGSPNFSYTSLDRAGANHLLAGEYCNASTATNGRVAAWPIAGAFDSNGELIMNTAYRWQADAAYKIPDTPRRIQGATRFNGRWYLSQSNQTNAGKLHITAKVTSPIGTLNVVDSQTLTIGPEDLSHWPNGTQSPSLGAMWTVAEHEGKRMVYSVTPIL